MGGRGRSRRTGNEVAKINSSDRGYSTFLDIKSEGWINLPLEVGVLRNVVDDKNRYVFEFALKQKVFNAWSTKNATGERNKKLLKIGHAYVLKGKLYANSNTEKYFRSSNATYKRYSLFLGKIEIIKKGKRRKAENTGESLSELKRKISSQTSFNVKVENVKIVSGSIYRYLGCEINECCAKLQPRPGKPGIFCKNKCHRQSQKGKVCILLRDVCIENDEQVMINGVTIFHTECEKLFGNDVTDKICRATSDQTAERHLKKYLRKPLNARLCHQKPKACSFFLKKSAVTKRLDLILKEINLIVNDENDEDEESGPGQSSSVPNLLSPRTDTSCECENLEDATEVDFDTIRESPLFQLSVTPSSSTRTEDNDLKYNLKPNPGTGNIGLAFVVNIKIADGLRPRNGSEKDVSIIQEVLPRLGIGIYERVFEDIDKKKFQNALKDFKKELIKEDYSCAFVVVMSHGVLHHIRMKDLYINVWVDVLSHFSEELFPEFRLKPKIFIMQSCQYYQVKHFTQVTDFIMPGCRFSDCLWLTPCLPGVKAKRSPDNGTYFIQNLMKCLDEYHNVLDLMRILHRLQEIMRNIKVGDEKKEYNIPVYSSMIFNRAFYFYPSRNDLDVTPTYDVSDLSEGVIG